MRESDSPVGASPLRYAQPPDLGPSRRPLPRVDVLQTTEAIRVDDEDVQSASIFELGEFERMTLAEVTAFERRVLASCCPEVLRGAGAPKYHTAVPIVTGCGRSEQPSEPAAAPATQAAASRGGDWMTYNGPLSGGRFFPLDQITTTNVGQLRQACAFDTPDTVSFQTGIVAVAGTLYFTAFGNTYAIDGTTCQQKWKQSRPEPSNMLMVNRGVGYNDGKLFRGTGDGHVLALDATNGAVLWDVTIADPCTRDKTCTRTRCLHSRQEPAG